MDVQGNVQIVKDGYAAFGRGDIQGLLACEDTLPLKLERLNLKQMERKD